MPTTSSTALFLFFITISTFPSIPESQVVVKNSRAPVNRTEGQPLSLKCTAEYEEELCGNIRVSWCLTVSSGCHQLTDSDRYLIHINETKTGWNRQQDAFISFTRVTLNDTGLYQCSAICQHNRATAVGRGISVNVTGDDNEVQQIPNQSKRCSVNMFLLTISVFILLWINKT